MTVSGELSNHQQICPLEHDGPTYYVVDPYLRSRLS